MRGVSPNNYSGTLTEATGPVQFTILGPRAYINYTMKGGLHVNQQLALQSDGSTILNELEVHKFGVRVATLNETISKASLIHLRRENWNGLANLEAYRSRIDSKAPQRCGDLRMTKAKSRKAGEIPKIRLMDPWRPLVVEDRYLTKASSSYKTAVLSLMGWRLLFPTMTFINLSSAGRNAGCPIGRSGRCFAGWQAALGLLIAGPCCR